MANKILHSSRLGQMGGRKMLKVKVKLIFSFFLLVELISFVLAVSWTGYNVQYPSVEDIPYYHNLTANITSPANDMVFAVDTLNTVILWNEVQVNYSNISSWVYIVNSTTGNFTINSTRDNETGKFVIPFKVTWNSGSSATTESFNFTNNATNDAPIFTNINSTYNSSLISPLLDYLNASDEELHYPLNFSVVFNSTSCTHASWSGYANNQNCSLYDFGFTLTNFSNTSALMNFTPVSNQTGIYYANISVRDYGDNYSCPHNYCDNSTYKVNKTTYYSTVVTFNVLSSLDVNITNCQNKVFQENQAGTCNITVRTKGEADSLNFSSYAILRNYAAGQAGVTNTSWFYANSTATSSNFEYNVTINITPQKTEIGNWTINFTALDNTYGESNVSQIYVHVNRSTSLNDVPDLLNVSDVTTSISMLTLINLSVYDDDLLIPDKNSSFGGYNETTSFTRTILNRSNLAQELPLSNFSITILQMPVSGTNRTSAEIRFTANSSDIGNYTINVTAKDNDNTLDFVTFNLTIINNTAPQWILPLTTTILANESDLVYLNFSQNVTDAEGDVLTFSYTNDTQFSSFNLNSTTGILNFTSIDADVGQHIVNITVSDGYLTNTTSFNFTIYNINDNPLVKSMDLENATNASDGATLNLINGTTINATEDNSTKITLWIEDDDLRIPSVQKSFYNESFTLNVTIQGANSSLFNFARDNSWWPQPESAPAAPNRTKYDATFTPRKADVGSYAITVNVTDLSNSSYVFMFYMNITGVEHDPVLSNVSNQTSAVNRSFYYDINVTDTENGNDTSGVNTNFTFSYQFLNDGNNASFLNSTNFNSTTGVINMTFNSTQDGKYHLNITVNDSGGRVNSGNFWIFVYGQPNITFPDSGAIFNLTENSSSVLNFTVNHSVGDNLTYEFYIDGIQCPYQSIINCNYTSSLLRNLTNYFGNATSLNWTFTPNLTDETYGLLKNLTLVVYPNSTSLENASSLNTSVVYKLNITHTNSQISFSGHISDQGPVSHDNDLLIDLAGYFSDLDYSDSYYSQASTWTIRSNGSSITSSVSGAWVLTLGSNSATVELINITGNDASSNATSNSFLVTFINPTSVSSSSSSGGGTTEIPVSLKILMPDPVSAYQQDRIKLPITLYNSGQKNLLDITLGASIAKNGSIEKGIKLFFSDNHLSSLAPGEKRNVTLTAEVNTTEVGLFEITVNATVKNPIYTDWGKLYLTIKEGVDIQEKILFTEEFIVSNPECIELKELVDEAKEYQLKGETEKALAKADEALTACKKAIAQAGKPKIKQIIENKLYRYLIFTTLGAFLIGVGYYSYKRMKLRRREGSFLQQDIKNRRYLQRY